MDTKEYFDLYELVLSRISEERPNDFDKLLIGLEYEFEINNLIEKFGPKKTVRIIDETVGNLIDDKLIKGTSVSTKDGNFYLLEGLTTKGYEYLSVLENDSLKNKAIKYLKDEGLPETPGQIVKAISRLFL